MPINKIYSSNTGENVLASYDFTDIQAGVGYQTFYLAESGSSTFLTNNSNIASQFIGDAVKETAGNNALQLRFDNTYDIEFKLPRTIDGKGYLSVPVYVSAFGDSKTITLRIDAWIQKYDGTTATNIINVSGSTAFSYTGTATTSDFQLLEIDIPKTHFRAGESLRLKMDVVGSASAFNNTGWAIGHNPNNWAVAQTRNSVSMDFTTAGTSTARLLIPFDLDL